MFNRQKKSSHVSPFSLQLGVFPLNFILVFPSNHFIRDSTWVDRPVISWIPPGSPPFACLNWCYVGDLPIFGKEVDFSKMLHILVNSSAISSWRSLIILKCQPVPLTCYFQMSPFVTFIGHSTCDELAGGGGGRPTSTAQFISSALSDMKTQAEAFSAFLCRLLSLFLGEMAIKRFPVSNALKYVLLLLAGLQLGLWFR